MNDFEAVSALLMLSTGIQAPAYPPHQQLPRPIPQAFGFYNENQENGHQDLSPYKPKCDTYNLNAKRFLSPSQQSNFVKPRTTSTPLKPIAGNNYSTYESFPYVDHSYAATASNASIDHSSHLSHSEQSIDLNSFHFTDAPTGVEDRHILPAPCLPEWSNQGDPRVGLPPAVVAEFNKILRCSSHVKEEYMQKRSKETPIEFEYNPRKSRLRKVYRDAEEAAGRAKNNLASRKSRQKKKVQMQLLNFSLQFDREENRDLYAQERWMTDIIADLEDKLLAKGYDAAAIRSLRAQCGMK